MKLGIIISALAIAGASLAAPVQAQQSYPTRPIKLVVPFPPGGTTDVLARTIADPVARDAGPVTPNPSRLNFTNVKFTLDSFTIVKHDGGHCRGREHPIMSVKISEAELDVPQGFVSAGGGREGRHFTTLGYILAEMQVLARQHPGATW